MTIALWTPKVDAIKNANMSRFISMIRTDYAPHIHDYLSLYGWSIRKPELFWPALWRFCDIKASRSWGKVLEHGHKMPGASWFKGAQLNFAENLLRRKDDATAILFYNESGQHRSLSYHQLYAQVSRLAQALRASGINRGDRIVGYLPNLPESVIAMLASTSIGAIWSSCSPDFGINGVLERFGQIRPKILFTADGYYYGGKNINLLDRIRKIHTSLESVKKIIVVPYLKLHPDLNRLSNATLYANVLRPYKASKISFEQLPFDHPVYIMYSSGTTGIPKCIVHGAGGTLLQHLKEHRLHIDLCSEDKIFYFTTCGWMMWNWLVSALGSGAGIVLYEGSAFFPKTDALIKLAEQESITVFGISAKYLSTIEKAGVQSIRSNKLKRLRLILSTGSPLAPESFDYVYQHIKADVQLSSISGGTDILSCFALGNPLLPVHRGELQCRGLGMKVEVFDDQGRSVIAQKGELVCSAPFPSMPIGFWNDPGGEKYLNAYFRKFPNVWAHGDFAKLTLHESMIIYGRSDATLNPGGVRIGTAEIYRQVEGFPEVLEGLAVGQYWQGDIRIVLFVRLKKDLVLNDALRSEIKSTNSQQHNATSCTRKNHSGHRHTPHLKRKDRRNRC